LSIKSYKHLISRNTSCDDNSIQHARVAAIAFNHQHEAKQTSRLQLSQHYSAIGRAEHEKKLPLQGQSEFLQYERNPEEALQLFWETASLTRFESDLHSDELLEEIRSAVISDQVKSQCLDQFQKEMDPDRLTLSICGVCNKGTFQSLMYTPISELSPLLRVSPDKLLQISKSPYKDCYTVLWFSDSKIAFHCNAATVKENKIPICNYCLECLQKQNLPKFCLANGYDFGDWTKLHLPTLNDAEKLAISLYRPFGKIIKLVAPQGLGTEAQQTALRGHIIHIPHDGPEILAQEVPRRNLADSIQVMFIGSRDQLEIFRRSNAYHHLHHQMFTIRAEVVMTWLHVLKQVNFLYKNIYIREYTLEEENVENLALRSCIENLEIANDETTSKIEQLTNSNIASITANNLESQIGLHTVLLSSDQVRKLYMIFS
jgi:hypothetical protein